MASLEGNSERQTTHFFDLPNEVVYAQNSENNRIDMRQVLVQALAYLPTKKLLGHRTVARRLHNVIIRILHGRLLQAAALKDRTL